MPSFSDSWNDRLKAIVSGVSSKIPYVGGAIKALIALFWPSSQVSIWDLIKEQVSQLVDVKILAKELEERNEELNGLKDTLNNYVEAKNHEKGALMSAMISQLNVLYSKFTQSSNAIHLIPLTVAASHLHLIILLERLSHGKDIYDEDNTLQWHKDLTDKYNDYIKFFRHIYPLWKEWRDNRVEVKWYLTKGFTVVFAFSYNTHGEVVDHVTSESINYQDSWNSNEDYFKNVCLAIQTRMRNQAVMGMVSTLASSFLLNAYLPGHENEPPDVDPNLSTFWIGPYSVATLGLNQAGSYSTNIQDEPGLIKQIYVREGDVIDGLQFIYTDREGHFIGNPKGGSLHTINVDNSKYIIGLRMQFAQESMCSIDIVFSDKSNSGYLGKRRDWSGWNRGVDVDATVDPSYELVCAKFRQDKGPFGVSPSVVELQFKHSSLLKA